VGNPYRRVPIMIETQPKTRRTATTASEECTLPPFLQWLNDALHQANENSFAPDELKFANLAKDRLISRGFSLDAMQNVEAAFMYYQILKRSGHDNAAAATMEFFKEQLT
jgi:hypothetical protein